MPGKSAARSAEMRTEEVLWFELEKCVRRDDELVAIRRAFDAVQAEAIERCMKVRTIHPVSGKLVSMHPVWVKAMEELE